MWGCNWKTLSQNISINVQLIRGIVLCASIFGLIFYVDECYIKLRIRPEVLVNEKLMNSRTVPFPAVTICTPFITKSEFLNLTKLDEEIFQNATSNRSEFKKLLAMSHICDGVYNKLSTTSLNKSNNANEAVILRQISPSFDDIFSVCSLDKLEKCENLFTRSLTDHGYCFSFNMLEHNLLFNDGVSKDFDCYKHKNVQKSLDSKAAAELSDHVPLSWTLEHGYLVDDNIVKPVRATRGRALVTELRNKISQFEHLCESRSLMVIVYLHLPNELPTMMHSEKLFKLSTANLMKITARVKQNDETLKNFRLEERGCFFEDEHNLKFFKSYTKINCEYECLINFTHEYCGCVKMSMPRTENMKMCKYEDIKCYQAIAKSWPNVYFASSKEEKEYSHFPCGCMPLCTQIRYIITDKTTVEEKFINDGYIHSTLSIWFEDSQIIKRTNYVTYKVQNFMSDVGGLIGLFLGFSLLSLFEFLLKVSSYLRRSFEGWTNRLKRQTDESRGDGTLTEIVSVKELRWFDNGSNGIRRNDEVLVLPGHLNAPLEIEDLEDYSAV